MFLALVAWLLLSSQCNCQQNFTLFMTGCPSAVTPDPTPDQVCASADGNDTSVEYRALVVLSNRRDLSAMFPDGSLLLNTLGEVMAYNLSQFLDPQARLALLYDSLSVLVGNDTEFWTGAVDNFGNLSDGNCADFTPDFVTRNWVWANIGTLDSGLYAGRALCDQAYVYLCAKGNFPQPTPASGSPSDVLTDEVNPHAGFDADVFCKQQSTQSPSPILQVVGLEVQAVAFTARRQNLHAMFPPDASIFDLDGNFLAANSVDFFTLLSPVSIRGSNGAIIDASVRFWTGTAADNLSGNLSGITCGDWTKGTTEGGATVGTLTYGLCSGSVSCGETARFLCAANVLPQAPTLGDPGATYLFFSQPVVVGTEELNATITPDMVCQAAADMANNSKFDGRQCIALVLTEARPTLEAYFQPGPVEDLNNNTLAPNMSDFWANNLVTTRSLTFANGEHVDLDYWFWSGGTTTDNNCENFTAAVQSTMAGTLMYGRGSQGVECSYALPFLCAALAPPTPAPTSSPTATPTTAAPTRTPSAAPTTMTTTTPAPSSAPNAVVSTNVTWNGTKTVLALGGGAIRQVEVTVSPDVAFGQNGTVEVAVLGNNSNTISTVVSVVFRDANGAALNVTNLTNPIVLGFSLSSSLADVKHCIDANPVESPILPQCGYYNTSTDTWETNGCSLATVNATWLQCECTHLTDFAVLAPKSNKIVPTDTLDLTPDNIAHNSTGLVAVLVMLAIFGIVFALAWRRDHSEAVEYAKLRAEKQEKWSSFMAEKKKTTFVKQVKIAFQKRHTWLSLVFRRAGTSFKSVDRTFVAMLSVFASMSMSANFHAQDNEGVGRVVSWILTVIACVIPAQFLMILFVRTGEMGFFEEWEYVSSGRIGPSNKCLAFRFPEQWRYVWRGATLIAVIGMIVYILTMSMRFDLQPYYYCQGEPAKAWVVTWLSAYAITAFGYEPLRLVLLASIAYQMDSRETATLKTLEMTAKDSDVEK